MNTDYQLHHFDRCRLPCRHLTEYNRHDVRVKHGAGASCTISSLPTNQTQHDVSSDSRQLISPSAKAAADVISSSIGLEFQSWRLVVVALTVECIRAKRYRNHLVDSLLTINMATDSQNVSPSQRTH